MSQYWFKPKTHGYGATPANWKGWVATLGFLSVILGSGYILVASQQSEGSTPRGWLIAGWALGVATSAALFARLARAKTDGQWGWRWGK
jgi:hypothetical protein